MQRPTPQTPRPEGDPNPAAPGEEIGDSPGSAGQHQGLPPDIDAGTGGRIRKAQRPGKEKPAGGAVNDRNVAGDSGAREPKSR
jgi:hypothetical protein